MPRDRNSIADYQRYAEAGKTKAETARALGVTWNTVHRMAQDHHIEFRRYGGARTKSSQRGYITAHICMDQALHEKVEALRADFNTSFSEAVCILCDKSLETFR